MTTLYTISNITFSYDTTSHSKINALSGLSLSINHGDRIASLGLSGSGKSTFLKMLGGLLMPSSGHIYYSSKPLLTPPDDVSLLLQSYGLFPWKTVEENLILPLLLKKLPYNEDLILYWLKALGLENKRKTYPKNLSGGQKQRLALGRSIITNPNCLLLDEPFSALDTLTKEDLLQFTLNLILKKNITLITVTHDIKEAIYLSSHILIFNQEKHLYLKNPLTDEDKLNENQRYLDFVHELKSYLRGETYAQE